MTSEANITGDHEAVDAVIMQRFACRRFTDQDVSRDIIADLLEVARFAPSGANIQPWKVYVLAGAIRNEVSRILTEAHNEASDRHQSEYQYYAAPMPEPYASRRRQFGRIFYGSLGIEQSDMEARARQTSKNYDFFGAPVGLIFTIDRRLEVGSWLDLGMFVQNVMIAAGARGLQICPQESSQETFARDVRKISRSAAKRGSDTSHRDGRLRNGTRLLGHREHPLGESHAEGPAKRNRRICWLPGLNLGWT